MESYKAVVCILVIYYAIFKAAMPMLAVRKQVDRIGHVIHSPIDSYFHESMRGISVIRAFGQSQTIIDKQYGLLDRTTQQFMVGHSCYKYSELIISMLTKLVFIAGVVIGVLNKGYISTVTIIILIQYADADFLIHMFNCFSNF